MTGHTQKRSGYWRVVVELGEEVGQRCPTCRRRFWADEAKPRTCPADHGELEEIVARRQEMLAGKFTTKKLAEKALRHELDERDQGTHVKADDVTVGRYLTDHWLPHVKPNVRGTTYLAYELHVEKRIIPTIGGIPLQKLSTMDVDRLYSRLRNEKGARGRVLSPATVKAVHRVLHHALAKAVDWNLIPRNPADGAQTPRVPRHEMTTWDVKELGAFLDFTAGDRLNPLWRVLAATGLRRGEALGLHWSDDVDLESRNLTIRRSRKQVGYDVVEENLKSDKPHGVPIDAGTVAALRRQAEQQLTDQAQWQGGWQNSDHVFTREDGAPWTPDRITKLFDQAVKAAGVKRIRLHDVRHTHGTLGLAAGVHPKIMSERLGHSSVAMTLDIYSHAIPTLQDSAADLMGAMIDDARAKA